MDSMRVYFEGTLQRMVDALRNEGPESTIRSIRQWRQELRSTLDKKYAEHLLLYKDMLREAAEAIRAVAPVRTELLSNGLRCMLSDETVAEFTVHRAGSATVARTSLNGGLAVSEATIGVLLEDGETVSDVAVSVAVVDLAGENRPTLPPGSARSHQDTFRYLLYGFLSSLANELPVSHPKAFGLPDPDVDPENDSRSL